VLHGHTEAVLALSVARGHLVSGSYDMTVQFWDINTLRCVRKCEGHQDAVRVLTAAGDTYEQVQHPADPPPSILGSTCLAPRVNLLTAVGVPVCRCSPGRMTARLAAGKFPTIRLAKSPRGGLPGARQIERLINSRTAGERCIG